MAGEPSTITADVNLLDLASGNYSGGLSWLSSDYFTIGGTNDMTGFYLFASDGWSYSTDTSKDYELTNGGNHSFSFPDRFPRGQGISDCCSLTDPGFKPIYHGGWTNTFSGSNYSSIDSTTKMTLTYYSRVNTENPTLNVGSYTLNPNSDPVESTDYGLYAWTFNVGFSTYDYSTNTAVSVVDNYSVVPLYNGSSCYISSQNSTYYYYANYYYYNY